MTPSGDAGLDLSPLTQPVSREDLRIFRRTAPGTDMPRLDPATPGLRTWLTTGLVALFAVPFVCIPGIALFTQGLSGTTLGMVLFGGLMAFGAVMILSQFRLPRWGTRLWSDRVRLSRFAERNRARYTAARETPWRPGMIFGRGERRRIFDVLDFTHPHRLRVGNLAYQKPLPKGGAEQHLWGFVEVSLPRRFPHIVLDSLSNNGLRGRQLENPYAGQGAVTLEGNFSQYFRLTCPPGYERDALYLLTPDLMVVLLDEGADFDIEILDDVLFLYRPRRFVLSDPAEWRKIERILDTIGLGTAKRTVNYRDERVGNRDTNTIAAQGSRLPRPRLMVGFIIVTVFAVVTILGALLGGQ
ncbi:hypothetical protein IWX78_001549 [Mycetocola sp. CAN_C7]|uniref:hypothetical protein n=1 Tax=Mycetocola sp. CAN_C7 TaxID=2787724 RepID=UPI0018CA4173